MTPATAAIAGFVVYLVGWLRHDALATRVGAWTEPPGFVRRVVRLGSGPLYAATLAFQLYGLVMLIGAAASVAGGSIDQRTLGLTIFGIIPVAAFWGVLALIDVLTTSRNPRR